MLTTCFGNILVERVDVRVGVGESRPAQQFEQQFNPFQPKWVRRFFCVLFPRPPHSLLFDWLSRHSPGSLATHPALVTRGSEEVLRTRAFVLTPVNIAPSCFWYRFATWLQTCIATFGSPVRKVV
jgi:hypothetical protein